MYKDEWSEIDQLEKKGLYNEALTKVKVLFADAMKQKAYPQVIKAVLFELKYNSHLTEDDYVLGISRLEGLITETPSPAKEILHYVLAEAYLGYYSSNFWRLDERTEIENDDSIDVRTWGTMQIVRTFRHHYLAALNHPEISQSYALNNFSEIIDNTEENTVRFPTLFDFLGQKAFHHFSNQDDKLPEADKGFPLDNSLFFGSNKEFSAIDLKAEHQSDTHFIAVKILKVLTEFNLKQEKQDALFYLELERLNFLDEESIAPEKSEWYTAGIERLIQLYQATDLAAEALYEKAYFHYESYKKRYSISRYDKRKVKEEGKIKAYAILIATIKKYPNTIGAKKCQYLLAAIKEKHMEIRVEETVFPNRIAKFLLTYQNVTKAHVKIIPMDHKEVDVFGRKKSKINKAIKKQHGVYNETLRLKDFGDFEAHHIELPLPALKPGLHYIAVSPTGSFDPNEGGFMMTPFWATSLTFQHQTVGDTNYIRVLDRLSGESLEGVRVEIDYKNDYRKKNKQSKSIILKTEKDGMTSFVSPTDRDSFKVIVFTDNDMYAPGYNIHDHNFSNSSQDAVTYLYTDRKIYRPGQKIYFKGIVLKGGGAKNELLKHHKSTVEFYDANYQVIEKIKVVSNQFGSFHGEFTAPTDSRTGIMEISNEMDSVEFNVEEYKRPKFKVAIDPPSGDYQVNEVLEVSGSTIAFAGDAIAGAIVTFRVSRGVSYNPYYWNIVRGADAHKSIFSGTTITDENGVFKFNFNAVPDKTCDAKMLPIFDYSINVSVTDINGESHGDERTIKVGYQSLNLGNNLPEEINKEDGFTIKLSAKNLNGQPIFSQGKITIEKLQTPDRAFYKRQWAAPDVQNWSESEFKDLFPDEAYANENDKEEWETDSQVFETQFDTEISKQIAVDAIENWMPGTYKYTAIATDKRGFEIRDEVYFTLFSDSDMTPATNDVMWAKCLQETAEPGDEISILMATAEASLSVLFEAGFYDSGFNNKNLNLDNKVQELKFIVTEEHIGGLSFSLSTVKKNRVFSEWISVKVPFTNKELDVSFTTFRNKLLPGETEEWVLKIQNKLGEQRQAELLATLYDTSLDALTDPNDFSLRIYHSFFNNETWGRVFGTGCRNDYGSDHGWNDHPEFPAELIPRLILFGWRSEYSKRIIRRKISANSPREFERGISYGGGAVAGGAAAEEPAAMDMMMGEDHERGMMLRSPSYHDPSTEQLKNLAVRSIFNETAFFHPQLTTDANGEINIKFTIPESLTTWRFLGLAHTEDLQIGNISKEIITSKPLMVVPLLPRFLRMEDEIILSAKITNLSEENLSGAAQIFLSHPITDEALDLQLGLKNALHNFTVDQGNSIIVSWKLNIGSNLEAVKIKIVAEAGSFSDGEEHVLPVLSNRMMVIESLPLPIRGKQSKSFEFKKLMDSNTNESSKHHQYTLEFTSNPAWYAIQAMPYMMEFPHDCTEQIFTRFYANALANHVLEQNPKFEKIIKDWGENSLEAFQSNLEKNPELKAVLLEETPWVLEAKSEKKRAKKLAALLDFGRMAKKMKKSLAKIQDRQGDSGGWSWFPDMKQNRFVTQHIVTGFGHLDRLGVNSIFKDEKTAEMLRKAVAYLDRQIAKDYSNTKKFNKDYLTQQTLGYLQLQYLYMRSFFPTIEINKKTKTAIDYYQSQCEKYWLQFNIYGQGMLALAANRSWNKSLAQDIVNSLKDRSITTEEFGMYWKAYRSGYYWWEAPVETQALMIELFDEVADDQAVVEELKIWLLKEKQTTNWKTTKQTTEAVYALLLKGTDLLASDNMVEVTVGGQAIEYSDAPDENDPYQVKAQAGTGYFKTAWTADQVKAKMGNITLSKKDEGVAWGAAYWQYFEDLDKITFAETNLKLQKDLYLVEVTNQGEQLKPINDKNVLKVGQKVRVR
ncbi:MAG: hypothetical protein GQ574_00840, partial [Crocinitomix sp.]|nr:hypothetical protein [Crocinitomix sp.]